MYDAAGLSLSASAQNNRFLYSGREWLQEIGLYDYRNRMYSAELGRFLQTDPIRFEAGDVNLYRYVANNAANWVDPLGLFILNPASGAGGGAAIGTAIFPGPGTVVGAAAGALIGTVALIVTIDTISSAAEERAKEQQECRARCNEDWYAGEKVCMQLPEPCRTKCLNDIQTELDRCIRKCNGRWF